MIRLLLVEDDPAQVATVSALAEGCEVTSVGTLREARAVLADTKFDIAILDLHLPDGRSSALLPLLTETVTILLSGDRDAPELQPPNPSVWRLGLKPVDPAILTSWIETAVKVAALPNRKPSPMPFKRPR